MKDDSLAMDSPSRRAVLQAIGAAGAMTGVSGATATTQADKPGRSIGEIYFTQAGITYDIESSLDDEWRLPYYSVDRPAEHVIDLEEKTLYLTSFASERAINSFKSNNTIVYNRKYSTPPMGISTPPGESLVTSRGHGNRPLEALRIKSSGFKAPSARLENRDRDAAVTANSPSLKANPSSSAVHQFSEQQVTIEVSRRPGGDDQSSPESEERTVTVRPSLSVKNFGRLEVRDASDEHNPLMR